LRSFNDALNSKAYNSINILVGFIVFVAISQQKFFMNGENETIKIIIAFVLGHTLLGLLTYLTSKRLIKNLKI
jgi:xanthine/uracil permease